MRRFRILIAAVSAGVAFTSLPAPVSAHWGAAGSGSGGAATTTVTTAVTISPGTTSHPLFPTGTASGGVAVVLTNTNAAAVRVPQLALDATRGSGGYAVDAGHASCPVSGLSYTTQTNGGAGWIVPAAGSLTLDLANAIALSSTAPNACQGASFTVYLSS
jgi:hypothetical protein